MSISLRAMQPDEWDEVSELIYLGTNDWYQTHGQGPIFTNGPQSARLFCEVYEGLDPGCCVIAVHEPSNKIVGSCFYHPRTTHVSLGIMNVHPNYFGERIASRLLKHIIEFSEARELPIRLVSSAQNLDSFSLYTRAGFVPQTAFQDMWIEVPEQGLSLEGLERLKMSQVRPATLDDVHAMAALELELNHISREKDFRYFIENANSGWQSFVFESQVGQLDGFLVSIQHPGSNMLGPGIARHPDQTLALIATQLDHQRGNKPVFLVPVQSKEVVSQLYRWGARNCEIHFSQVRGHSSLPTGIVMPTFMPETG